MAKKRSPIQIAKDKAWKALSKMKRARGRCQRCGKVQEPATLDAHHIIPRSKGNYAMFEPDNIIVLCGFYCHRNWWHGISTWDEQMELVKKTIGLDRYYEIKQASNQIVKYSVDDYEEMIENFNQGGF
jgi:5-methylcytosine-specific restriction endonuclease McrA